MGTVACALATGTAPDNFAACFIVDSRTLSYNNISASCLSGSSCTESTEMLPYGVGILNPVSKPKLTSNAVRDHLIRMNAIFQFAKVNDFVNINIFEGVNVEKQDVNRGPWSKEELEILFAKSNFQTFIEPHSRIHYWVPLVAAFTGA